MSAIKDALHYSISFQEEIEQLENDLEYIKKGCWTDQAMTLLWKMHGVIAKLETEIASREEDEAELMNDLIGLRDLTRKFLCYADPFLDNYFNINNCT